MYLLHIIRKQNSFLNLLAAQKQVYFSLLARNQAYSKIQE